MYIASSIISLYPSNDCGAMNLIFYIELRFPKLFPIFIVGNSNIKQTFNFNHLKNHENNLKELLSYEIVENSAVHLLTQNSRLHVLSVLRYTKNTPCCKHFGTPGISY